MPTDAELDHIEYDRIEESLNAALAESLHPRGPDVLFDVIASLGLASGAVAVDVGCGAGRHTVELARRFGLAVHGIDPLPRYRDAEEAVAAGAASPGTVTFTAGSSERLPHADASVDLVMYREVLYLVPDLATTLSEARRVLHTGGRIVVYQLFNTDWLEPRERERFWQEPAHARNADTDHFEAAVAAAGLAVDDVLELQGETVEWAEEQNGKASRELLAVSRLLRHRERYARQFSEAALDIKLIDSLWFIYRMLGKLTQRTYVLRPS